MAKYRIIYIMVLIAALVLACAYNSKLTLVLLIAAAALPIVTLFILITERLALKFETVPDRVFSQKLQHFTLTVIVRNRFIFPVSPMKITGSFQDEDGDLVRDKTLIVSIMPFCRTELKFSGCLKYRGEYILGPREAVIYDLLGIFRFRIRLNAECPVIIAPRRLSLDRNSALCSDDSDSSRTRRSFFENNSFSAVREYVEGDTLRYVHWKLSAKLDKLMVKQMEQNLGTNAMVITDTCGRSADTDSNIRAVDAAIEASLAITSKIIGDGRCALNLFRAADEAPAELFSAESAEDHEQLYYAFSVVPILKKGGAASLIQDISDRQVSSETVFITTQWLSADELHYMLGSGLSGCKDVRVFLTGGEPDRELRLLAEADERLKIAVIEPENIALSLRNALSG